MPWWMWVLVWFVGFCGFWYVFGEVRWWLWRRRQVRLGRTARDDFGRRHGGQLPPSH